MEAVTVAVGQISYKGPHVHCYDQQYEFMGYLGRLQERSYWKQRYLTEGALLDELPPLAVSDPEAELRPEDPTFQFVTCTHSGNSLTGQGRDYVAEAALEAGADYLFFFDDDMVFPKSTFLKLYRHRKPVIAALAFTAREPMAPVLYRFDRGWDFKRQCEKVDIVPLWDYPTDQLIGPEEGLQAVGTGVVLINIDVFRQIPRPWFHGSVGSGEDVHFCWQCHQARIPIYADTSAKTWHVPNYPPKWACETEYRKARAR